MTIAFVFPGQGSQSVGMLNGYSAPQGESSAATAAELDMSRAVQAVLAEADAALSEDLSGLIAQGPVESLNLTTNTQPAMLVAGCAALAAWRAVGGPEPAAVAGHSLGEYSALVAAGSLSLGLRLCLSLRGSWQSLRHCGQSVTAGSSQAPPASRESRHHDPPHAQRGPLAAATQWPLLQ